MYIEDDELRDIYKSVTPERVQKLEGALMYLEKQPHDTDKLEEFLREAHTLKGDSRMLGVTDVETLVHQMEDCMVGVKQGERVITSDLCDRLYHGLDAIRKLIDEAVTGKTSGINTFLVLAQLMGAEQNGNSQEQDNTLQQMPTVPEALVTEDINLFEDLFESVVKQQESLVGGGLENKAVPVTHKKEITSPLKSQKSEVINPQPTIHNQRETDSFDSIRVDSEKLDNLIRQTGELNITKGRISRRLNDIEEIFQLYEDWTRDNLVNRSKFQQLEQELDQPSLTPFHKFWKRAEQRLEKLGDLVSHLKFDATEDNNKLESITNELESGLQNLRLLPLSTLFNPFNRMVRDLGKQQGKEINLVIEGGETRADKRILEEMKDPLLHIFRNAIDHGIETPTEREKLGKPRTATIRLRGYQSGNNIGIEVLDDGRGLDIESIKRTAARRSLCTPEELAKMTKDQLQSLIFTSGFSTRMEVTELSGRGMGLEVVRINVERLKGSIQVESTPGMGCEFRLLVSANLVIPSVLLVEIDHIPYAIPLEFLDTVMLVSRQEIFAIEGSQTINFEGQPVSVFWLADLLELPLNAPASAAAINSTGKTIPCVILKVGTERLGLFVDQLIDRQEVFLKPQSKLLKRVRNISGATILPDGQVCMVLNAQDLCKSVQKGGKITTVIEDELVTTKSKLLLVEDSIIIRTQMKRLLEGAGYEVTIAVDGLEGYNKLRTGHFDAVVSDVEMPNLNGLELTAKIRQHPEYSELPILLVTTLAKETDKRRGAEAGANAYLTKGDFDQKVLIQTLKQLI
ncbi:hybrid sensor histidine kinase/response regulator [Aphanothece sacrum]|nr:hybrid sensor histidine kinase/response regulator [Aphanothece sacrum]